MIPAERCDRQKRAASVSGARLVAALLPQAWLKATPYVRG
jgi:hypothetical protein